MLITEPGTIDNLVADAAAEGHEVTRRLIRDWTEKGLLDYPGKRPAGKGRGSRPALYSANQRMLFLTLLSKRTGTGISSVARIPVGIWLYWGDTYVPLHQVRRAFITWLGDPRLSKERARDTAKTILSQIAHPDAGRQASRELLTVLTDIGYTGQFDANRLEGVARSVFEPGHGQIRRAVGHPDAPMTTEAFIDVLRAHFIAVDRLNAGEVTDEDFVQARRAYLITYADYTRRQPVFAASAPQSLKEMYAPVTFESVFNQCCTDLLTVIGLAILYPAERTTAR